MCHGPKKVENLGTSNSWSGCHRHREKERLIDGYGCPWLQEEQEGCITFSTVYD